MDRNGGNQNIAGNLGNVPGHYPLRNLSLSYFVNEAVFERKVGVLNLSFSKQVPVVDFGICEFGSGFEYGPAPTDVIIQLQGKLPQSFGGVAGMQFSAPCPRVEQEGRAGSGGAAICGQHKGNCGAFNVSCGVNLNRI